MKRRLTLTAIALLAAVSAFALVTFDPQTGTGFVGKGDVMDALGFKNNKDINDFVLGGGGKIYFQYTDIATGRVTCVKNNTQASNFINDFTRNRSVASIVSLDRTNKNEKNLNLNGFVLTGYQGGGLPAGNGCPSGDVSWRLFDVTTDWNLPGVECSGPDQNMLPCWWTDYQGSSGKSTVYPVLTVTGSSGGVLSVSRSSSGPWTAIWPPIQ